MASNSVPHLNRSGIYEILNSVNGKRYIGSAVSLRSRWSEHRSHLARGSHHSRHLQAAWRKYGADAFSFRPLILCSKENLLFYEQIAMDAMNPEYNVARIAGSSIGCIRTPETRAKIADKARGRKWTDEARKKLSAAVKGRILSLEHVAHLMGNKHAAGLKHTDEWKLANSARQRGMKRPKDAAYRAKIAATLTGRKLTAEHRAKVAAALRGKKRGPYGPRKPEVAERMARLRASRINPLIGRKRPPDVVLRMSQALTGRALADEQRRNIAEGCRRMWSDPLMRAHMLERRRVAREKRKASA